MRRNERCSCGSGLRFKSCCGRVDRRPGSGSTRREALDAHRRGQFTQAETLYLQALQEDPNDIDVLHMLGVVYLQRMRYSDALELLFDAARRSDWQIGEIRHNLGLVLAKLLAAEANERQTALLAAKLEWESTPKVRLGAVAPRVSVVLPSFNHERFIVQAINSVLTQTYPNIELIVIDDGSSDQTPLMAAEALRKTSRPHRLIVRENRGAPATLNEGASLAVGEYIAFLNSDDYYTQDRIACLVDEISNSGALWGFSLVKTFFDVISPETHAPGDAVDRFYHMQTSLLGKTTAGLALAMSNVSISTGNLFVARRFFNSLGGFKDYRYNHDWDFCLRAIEKAEPKVVYKPLYIYRWHDRNTISEDGGAAMHDAEAVLTNFLSRCFDQTPEEVNPFGPYWPGNRMLALRNACREGMAKLLPVSTLRDLAVTLSERRQSGGSVRLAGNLLGKKPVALVVLGMHRSGTSALARVINLCGAYLPAKVQPPHLRNNAKGFWEPVDVIDLNDRVLKQLGGSWDRVDFALPGSGPIFEEFKTDALDVLEREYGGETFVVIKDPRIGVLAPWWHEALLAAGYRPVYAIPVRDPIEVAQSLHARGDMSIERGLSLWHAYSERIESFVESRAEDVIHLRYVDLIDDWRYQIRRIADHLDVSLSGRTRAAQVDSFLESSMRHQRAEPGDMGATDGILLSESSRRLYTKQLEQCSQLGTFQLSDGEASCKNHADSVTFVLCIENNGIREQALLLCESIRRFAGRYRDARIMAFSPREGLAVDTDTRAKLEAMQVEYIDIPLNTKCPEYGSANRVVAAAWAERHVESDFLVVLDSDTVFLNEPWLPHDFDAVVRPVDSKGSASCGPGDYFEPYWRSMADLAGVQLDDLPYLESTIGRERIRASYNGGLVVVRRNQGLMARWNDLFMRSIQAGLRPYRKSGMNIHASTGYVGTAASEFWGSNQTALALTLWSGSAKVLHYPPSYNVPLHLIAAEGFIDPVWKNEPPIHLHYHWMFQPTHQEQALSIMYELGVYTDRLGWLARRLPVGSG